MLTPRWSMKELNSIFALCPFVREAQPYRSHHKSAWETRSTSIRCVQFWRGIPNITHNKMVILSCLIRHELMPDFIISLVNISSFLMLFTENKNKSPWKIEKNSTLKRNCYALYIGSFSNKCNVFRLS